MLVVVPVELAGEFRELHEGVIEFARDLRAPVIAEATERLAKIDFVHVGSLAYSVHESVRVPIRFIARSNTALSSSERARSEEHTSELQSLMRISYAVFCLKKKKRAR